MRKIFMRSFRGNQKVEDGKFYINDIQGGPLNSSHIEFLP